MPGGVWPVGTPKGRFVNLITPKSNAQYRKNRRVCPYHISLFFIIFSQCFGNMRLFISAAQFENEGMFTVKTTQWHVI